MEKASQWESKHLTFVTFDVQDYHSRGKKEMMVACQFSGASAWESHITRCCHIAWPHLRGRRGTKWTWESWKLAASSQEWMHEKATDRSRRGGTLWHYLYDYGGLASVIGKDHLTLKRKGKRSSKEMTKGRIEREMPRKTQWEHTWPQTPSCATIWGQQAAAVLMLSREYRARRNVRIVGKTWQREMPLPVRALSVVPQSVEWITLGEKMKILSFPEQFLFPKVS
jgi:hypothetical protein